MFLGELSAVFADYHTDSVLEFAEFLNTRISHTSTTCNPLLERFFSWSPLHSYAQKDKKEAWKAR